MDRMVQLQKERHYLVDAGQERDGTWRLTFGRRADAITMAERDALSMLDQVRTHQLRQLMVAKQAGRINATDGIILVPA